MDILVEQIIGLQSKVHQKKEDDLKKDCPNVVCFVDPGPSASTQGVAPSVSNGDLQPSALVGEFATGSITLSAEQLTQLVTQNAVEAATRATGKASVEIVSEMLKRPNYLVIVGMPESQSNDIDQMWPTRPRLESNATG